MRKQKSKYVRYDELIEKRLTIIINHENQYFNLDVESSKTTGCLEEYLKNEVKKHSIHQYSFTGSEPDERKAKCEIQFLKKIKINTLVSFNTVDKNLPIDYYLQQSNKSLEIFSGQTLNLQPFYGPPLQSKITYKGFIFVKCVGVCGFSRVYLVKKKSNGRFYAMKLIGKEFILQRKKQGIVQNERDIMKVLDHPTIIILEYAFESKKNSICVRILQLRRVVLVIKTSQKMTEDKARFYFTDIDKKPEKILIDIDDQIRIADFGLSKPNMIKDDYSQSFYGSPEYMAPEILLKVGHNIQVDHYCLGAFLSEIVTGLHLYYSRDTDKISESILNEELTFPKKLNLSSIINNFLQGLLCKQLSKRLGVNKGLTELLTHSYSWFKIADLVAILQKQVSPPFKINQLKFNYNSNNLMKGELETREKYQARMAQNKKLKYLRLFTLTLSNKNS